MVWASLNFWCGFGSFGRVYLGSFFGFGGRFGFGSELGDLFVGWDLLDARSGGRFLRLGKLLWGKLRCGPDFPRGLDGWCALRSGSGEVEFVLVEEEIKREIVRHLKGICGLITLSSMYVVVI